MVEVYLSPRAKRDFMEIGEYTRGQWSQQQAETYLGQLLNVIRQIGEYPCWDRNSTICVLATVGAVRARISYFMS